MLAAAGTAAHHGFELWNGVGLVGQPELGLVGSSLFWGVQLPVWLTIAARGGRRWDGLLAAWSGAGLAGALVHFTLWPWEPTRCSLPVLTAAEGLPARRLPAYNMILYAWAVASVLSLSVEVSPRARWWALVGLGTFPLLRRSARHHFVWVTDQAAVRPRWWNRGLRPPVHEPRSARSEGGDAA